MAGRTKKSVPAANAEGKPKNAKAPSAQPVAASQSNQTTSKAKSKANVAGPAKAASPKTKTAPDKKTSTAKTAAPNVSRTGKSESATKSTTHTKPSVATSKSPAKASTKADSKAVVAKGKTAVEANVKTAKAKPTAAEKAPVKTAPTKRDSKSEKNKATTAASPSTAKNASAEAVAPASAKATKQTQQPASKLDKKVAPAKPDAKHDDKTKAKKVKQEPVIPPSPPTDPKVVEKLRAIQEKKERSRDLAREQDARPSLVHSDPLATQPAEPGNDRLVLLVRDPYWLHASWDISRRAVQRAKAALSGQWHSVKPILRLMHLDDSGTTANAEAIVKDIEIHSGVRNWYIPVMDPPSVYVAALGYLCSNGRFHELCRSNKVRTPVPGSNDAIDDHWADIAKDAERVYGCLVVMKKMVTLTN